MSLPKTPSFKLNGKKAFVPGGSRGIGLGCAVALAEAGADVMIVARSERQIEDAVTQMQDAGFTADGLAMDITELESVKAHLDHHKYDILCNSAGLARHSPAFDASEEDYDAVMAINVKAAYFLATEVARGMGPKGGSIMQISSQMGHVGGIDRTVYCATKHAVEGMTKAMAIEWGPRNIRVNTICPTFIRTPLSAVTFDNPDRLAWIKEKIKLPRVGEIEDIMGAVQFLASDASAMVTGTSILIDGGWTAG